MFDPRRLIGGVQVRPCLWDLKDKNYSNRSVRRIAWDQIAEELNLDWHTYTVSNKKEIDFCQRLGVYAREALCDRFPDFLTPDSRACSSKQSSKKKLLIDIQSKWKHIKEYYLREKKKNNNFDSNSTLRPRVPQYFDMLNFLDVTADNRPKDSKLDIDKPSDINSTNDFPVIDVDSFFLPSSQTTNSSETCDDILSAFQTSLLNSIPVKETLEEDADRSFLLSLLPEIKSMTPKEKFDLKFEILSAIKRIKYDPQPSTVDGNSFCPEPTSSTQYAMVEDNLASFSLP